MMTAPRVATLWFALGLWPFLGTTARAQEPPPAESRTDSSRAEDTAVFLGGAGLGLLAHESGHLLFNALFDGRPDLKKVSFGGIPFFAITHRDDLSPRREYAVSAAGLWVQHAASEWILTARPGLREEHSPLLKGWLAFNILGSATYAGAAIGRVGPAERDTRSMAASRRASERWMGVLVLAPAALDVYRYFKPESAWARWSSRAAKAGLVLLVLK